MSLDNGASTVEEFARQLLLDESPITLELEVPEVRVVDEVVAASTLAASSVTQGTGFESSLIRAQEIASAELNLTTKEQKIRVIEREAAALYPDIKNIPNGGKKKIMLACQEANKKLFGASEHPFNAAWKAALEQHRVRMEKHNIFARR